MYGIKWLTPPFSLVTMETRRWDLEWFYHPSALKIKQIYIWQYQYFVTTVTFNHKCNPWITYVFKVIELQKHICVVKLLGKKLIGKFASKRPKTVENLSKTYIGNGNRELPIKTSCWWAKLINTLWPELNGRDFAYIFKWIFVNEKHYTSI